MVEGRGCGGRRAWAWSRPPPRGDDREVHRAVVSHKGRRRHAPSSARRRCLRRSPLGDSGRSRRRRASLARTRRVSRRSPLGDGRSREGSSIWRGASDLRRSPSGDLGARGKASHWRGAPCSGHRRWAIPPVDELRRRARLRRGLARRNGRSGPAPLRAARRLSRSTSGRAPRPTARTRCPGRRRPAPRAGAAR